jgi:membrane fusion protein (multidrug efflux system)
MNKQTKILLIVAVVAIIAIIYIYPRWNSGTNSGPTPTAGPRAGDVELPVTVVTLKKETLKNQLNVTGTILPNESVSLRPEVSGLVTKISFKEGQYVSKGTPLLYLNDNDLQAQYQKLEYTQKLFESQENRQKQLLAREAISQEEYDIVLNQYNTTLSDLKLVEAQIQKTIVRAPFNGTLGLRQVSEGSVIGTGDIIATVVNMDPIKIEFSIPERYANMVEVGAPVFFSSESTEGEAEGRVYAFEPRIDAATRTLKLRAQSSNKGGKFLPGMFVKIRFVLGEIDSALMVPAESVIPELQGYKVFVVGKDQKAEERSVEIGTRTESHVQITKGLEEGEMVLTSGVLQARPGSLLKITITN